jgi:hypothetical protein
VADDDKTIRFTVPKKTAHTEPAEVNDGRTGKEVVSQGTGSQDGIDATIVGIAPNSAPIPAVVVEDKRDTLGKRLAFVGLGLLVLFFLISSYIQSSQNGKQLDQAQKSNQKLTTSLSQISDTLDAQTALNKQLQTALKAQNKALREAGLPTVKVPTVPGSTGQNGSDPSTSGSGNTPSSDTNSGTNSGNSPGGNSGGSSGTNGSGSTPPAGNNGGGGGGNTPSNPNPGPTAPAPVVPAGELVCNLVGICLNN